MYPPQSGSDHLHAVLPGVGIPTRVVAIAPPSLPLLHGASGLWDEILVLGGIGAIILVLGFLSWRAGRKRRARRSNRRSGPGH